LIQQSFDWGFSVGLLKDYHNEGDEFRVDIVSDGVDVVIGCVVVGALDVLGVVDFDAEATGGFVHHVDQGVGVFVVFVAVDQTPGFSLQVQGLRVLYFSSLISRPVQYSVVVYNGCIHERLSFNHSKVGVNLDAPHIQDFSLLEFLDEAVDSLVPVVRIGELVLLEVPHFPCVLGKVFGQTGFVTERGHHKDLFFSDSHDQEGLVLVSGLNVDAVLLFIVLNQVGFEAMHLTGLGVSLSPSQNVRLRSLIKSHTIYLVNS